MTKKLQTLSKDNLKLIYLENNILMLTRTSQLLLHIY